MNIIRKIRRKLHINGYIVSHKLRPLFTRAPTTEIEAAEAARMRHDQQHLCTDCGKVVTLYPDGDTMAMYDQDTIDYANHWNEKGK